MRYLAPVGPRYSAKSAFVSNSSLTYYPDRAGTEESSRFEIAPCSEGVAFPFRLT
jgi:hypothetical protein